MSALVVAGLHLYDDQCRSSGNLRPAGSGKQLILARGLLNGTPLVNASRLSVGARSPLKETNDGGTAAAALGKMGITAIVREGQAPKGDWNIL